MPGLKTHPAAEGAREAMSFMNEPVNISLTACMRGRFARAFPEFADSAAAIRVDARHGIPLGGLHDGHVGGRLDLMGGAVMFDIGDFDHAAVMSLVPW